MGYCLYRFISVFTGTDRARLLLEVVYQKKLNP